ncbi:MAG: ABC transporter ATP-binding protein/permease [Hyphomicrobiales bacterium]|nr:ABC transporter ATP-binding protein/permease [Hyphomicrobiales bacterium]
MLSRFFAWFEQRIDPFAPFDDKVTPPARVGAFIWHYIAPFRGLVAVNFAFALVIGIMESGMILLAGRFVDLLVSSQPADILVTHGAILAGLALFVAIIRPALMILGEVVLNQALVTPIYSRVRWRTHLYTLGHSLNYFQSDFAGRLANRVMQSGPAIQAVTLETLDNMAYVVIYVVVAFVAFTNINLVFGLPILAWAIAYSLLLRQFVPRAVALSAKQSDARSALLGRIVDSYTNILTVKLFARDHQERSAVKGAIERHTRLGLDTLRLLTIAVSVLILLNTLLLLSTGGLSLSLWRAGEMSVGEAGAALAMVMRLNDMSRWVMHLVRSIFENVGTVQESMDTIAKPHTLLDAPAAGELAVPRGEIVFDNVTFHYGKGKGIIDQLNLRVAPGEKVGIVGPSGAGKSTIVSLLLRLHEVEGGAIRIDGQDIAAVRQESLRRSIGVVTQDNALLHRSIEENIRYGRTEAGEHEIIAAAKAAQAHDFILGLGDKDGNAGYAARVGERGVKLSGGQRQRIAIARILLKNAPILVLDEATSALDSEIEAAIQSSLADLMHGKTAMVIAHRLSTIAALDRLVVMDDGRIVEEGAHADLIHRGGLYARLWARQSGGFLGLAAA